ncbi:hypothetical protein BJX70DRAFT_29053 [Aspergillus crustosus]
MATIGEDNHKKRKLLDGPELEIDVSAPEPPSKKALRKAKKKGPDTDVKPSTEGAESKATTTPGTSANPENADQKRSDYGIWIGNLAFSVTKDDLRRFFTANCSFTEATITRIHLPKPSDKNTRAQNKGFAYVDFSNPKALKEALDLSEQMVSGRRVLIKDAKNYQGRPEKSQEDEKDAAASGKPPSKRVFVGNLSFDTTKDLIEEHFSRCGPINNVHVATFQDSGKCKGYAWVEFDDLAASDMAVKGFKLITEDDEDGEDEEAEAEKPRKPLKPRKSKIWLNQLLGRRMRVEFAEDPTTRYNKRYGKNGEVKKNANGETEAADIEEVMVDDKSQRNQATRHKKAKPEYSRYDQSTVQKLSGAIIEGQGKKTTFD